MWIAWITWEHSEGGQAAAILAADDDARDLAIERYPGYPVITKSDLVQLIGMDKRDWEGVCRALIAFPGSEVEAVRVP